METERKEYLFNKLWKTIIVIILGFVFFVPILSSVFSIVLVIITIGYVYQNPKSLHRFKERRKGIIFLSSIYLVAILGLIWTGNNNIIDGLATLEAQISILLFPIIFSFIKINTKDIIGIISYLALLFIVIFTYLFIDTIFFKDEGAGLSSFMEIIGKNYHRTYISLYILSFSYILFVYHSIEKSLKSRIWGYFYLITLLPLTQLFESRISLLTIPILTFITFFYLKNQKILFGLVILLVSFSVSFIVLKNNSQRLKDISQRYKLFLAQGKFDKLEDRIIVWKISYDIIRANYLIGVGTGDAKENILTVCKAKTPNLTYTDVHNQYLDILIRYGLIGFLVFAASLVYPLYFSIKSGHPYYLIFLIVILVFFLTESILIRQIGVMFYAIFNSMFYYSSIASKESNRALIEE